MADFALLESPKLISRKILMMEKLEKFYSVVGNTENQHCVSSYFATTAFFFLF